MKSFIKKFILLVRPKKKDNVDISKKYKKTKFTRPLFFLDLSSRWDFVCSFPVVFYISKGVGIFAMPLALLISIFVLIIANYIGLYTVQRSNKFLKLSISLILLILMIARVSFSGVGIHLITQSKYLKENKATKILSQRNLLNTQETKTKIFEELFTNANSECNRLAAKQSTLDRSKASERRLWSKLNDQMYRLPKDFEFSDTNNLLMNFSKGLGSCTIRNYFNNLNKVANQNLNESFDNSKRLENELSPLVLLYISSRNSYYAHFKGNPLANESYEMGWVSLDPTLGIQVEPTCDDQDKNCKGSVRWTRGSEAIKFATYNFYEKLGDRKFKSLGFSFLGFFVSFFLNSITLLSFITLANRSE